MEVYLLQKGFNVIGFEHFSHRNDFVIHHKSGQAHHAVFHDFRHVRNIFDLYRKPHGEM